MLRTIANNLQQGSWKSIQTDGDEVKAVANINALRMGFGFHYKLVNIKFSKGSWFVCLLVKYKIFK